MNLIITVAVSLVLSFVFALKFKKHLILLLTIIIPATIIIEIIITKDISAFYYRYYYHWLFLLPLLLVLPLGFIKERKKASKLLLIFFSVWLIFLIYFPLMTVINNIKYLNTDIMWFDQFAKKYALRQANIYDYINWQFPKTKDIIKWCENQRSMVNLYSIDPSIIITDNESGFHAFLINCNYQSFRLNENKLPKELAKEVINQYPGAFYVSLEKCQPAVKNPFSDKLNSQRYKVNQELVCSLKETIPYLYIFPK